MAGKCEWCGKSLSKSHIVSSLGTQYNICDKCKADYDNEVCIKCGETVIGMNSIKGKCYACSQEEYEEKQRRADELAAGVDTDLMEFYSSPLEITEEDYEKWVTFSISMDDNKRKHRSNWIRHKLAGHNGWTPELIEKHFDKLEAVVDRYIRQLITNEYTIVYYDAHSRNKQRIHSFVANSGPIFVVETKKKK